MPNNKSDFVGSFVRLSPELNKWIEDNAERSIRTKGAEIAYRLQELMLGEREQQKAEPEHAE